MNEQILKKIIAEEINKLLKEQDEQQPGPATGAYRAGRTSVTGKIITQETNKIITNLAQLRKILGHGKNPQIDKILEDLLNSITKIWQSRPQTPNELEATSAGDFPDPQAQVVLRNLVRKDVY